MFLNIFHYRPGNLANSRIQAHLQIKPTDFQVAIGEVVIDIHFLFPAWTVND